MIEIWFEPHSTTKDNENNLASGWNDVDLSELGIKQCFELADRNQDRNLNAIFSSDLQRAVKSAVPSSDKLRIPIYADSRLRECNYGIFTHKSKAEVENQKVDRIDDPFPNGESYQQCIDRMKDFLDWLKNSFDGQKVLIIGHRATHYGLEHLINNVSIIDCVTTKFVWQPGWKYELK